MRREARLSTRWYATALTLRMKSAPLAMEPTRRDTTGSGAAHDARDTPPPLLFACSRSSDRARGGRANCSATRREAGLRARHATAFALTRVECPNAQWPLS